MALGLGRCTLYCESVNPFAWIVALLPSAPLAGLYVALPVAVAMQRLMDVADEVRD